MLLLVQDGRALDGVEVADDLINLLGEYPCPNCLVWAKVDAVVEHVKAVSHSV